MCFKDCYCECSWKCSLCSTMFWSDWGKKPMIAMAGTDGSSPRPFVLGVHWPNGITVDLGNERLYWVDAKLQSIESVNLDGADRRVRLSDCNSYACFCELLVEDVELEDICLVNSMSWWKFVGDTVFMYQCLKLELRNMLWNIFCFCTVKHY